MDYEGGLTPAACPFGGRLPYMGNCYILSFANIGRNEAYPLGGILGIVTVHLHYRFFSVPYRTPI